jgi:hydroxyacylglutathione hydrolase
MNSSLAPEHADITDYEFGISAIDSQFVRPHLDAVHLIREHGRAAIVDTGTNHSVPHILDALARHNVPREAVDFVILTHVHLDHAGGAGLLMRKLPNARLLVHKRGAPHMRDPSRLIASTIEVYGRELAWRMYGEILPIDPERMQIVGEGDVVSLAGRELEFFDTPGHARHHVCIFDRRDRQLFVGDMFGLSYRELDVDGRAFVFPATTPTQFDPIEFHQSIGKLLTLEPEALYLTHYGRVHDAPRLAADLLRLVDQHAQLARECAAEKDFGVRARRLEDGVSALARAEANAQGWAIQGDDLTRFLEIDIRLNAQGLAAYIELHVRRIQ